MTDIQEVILKRFVEKFPINLKKKSMCHSSTNSNLGFTEVPS